jgi:type IV pilus assembly protein PilM
MAKVTGVWGIDLGQCALKAIRLELIDGQPTATAYDYIEHPKILSQPDADPDQLTREALEKFLERNPLKKDQVAVSIPGQSGLARFVKLPPVEEKKIPEIVKFEAKQQIPFPLDEVVWDYQKIAGGESVAGFAMETEVGLFAMKRDVINRFLSHYQAVKAGVHIVQMAPLALCNFATYEFLRKGGPDGVEGDQVALAEGEVDDTPRGKKRCAVVLDIGTDNSNLVITDGGKIIWQRPLPLGGNHFTRALTKEMKLTFAKAEHLKRNAAKSPELATILRSLRPVLNEFVSEVQRSLGYFTNTHREAHVAYMVGLGNAFRLPGLQKYMAEKLSLDVRKPSRLQRIFGDAVLNDPNFTENILTFPIAIGLALQGLELSRLQTNLLPNEIRVERLIRAKKPWAAAAAACLLVGTGAIALGYSNQYHALSDPAIDKAMNESKAIIQQAKQQESDRLAKKTQVDATSAEVKTIITGNDERLNWIRLNEVLVAALPRHGDASKRGNLNDPEQRPFWSTDEGDRAFEKYLQRMKEGIPLEKMLDDDLSEHLANVNIEAVTARYLTNVGEFLSKADAYVAREYNRNIAEDMLESEQELDQSGNPPRVKPKPVEGPGWIVEIRGYTNHKDGTNFLRKTLIKNLQKADRFAAETGRDFPISQIIPEGKDPVEGKISHVFLLKSETDPTPPRNQFRIIQQSWIATVMQPAKATSAGPGAMYADINPEESRRDGPPGAPGAPGGAPGSSTSPASRPWTPLIGAEATLLDPLQPQPGSAPGGPSAIDPMNPTGQPRLPPGVKLKPRYEFVVCLIWREPISDATTTSETRTSATPQ